MTHLRHIELSAHRAPTARPVSALRAIAARARAEMDRFPTGDAQAALQAILHTAQALTNARDVIEPACPAHSNHLAAAEELFTDMLGDVVGHYAKEQGL